MHIVLLIVGVLMGAAFWWYRIKMLGGAAREAVDTVGRARGYMRRRKSRIAAGMSPVSAVDDPVTLASIVMAAIATDEGPVGPSGQAAHENAVAAIAEAGAGDEAVIYGRWAAEQIDDANVVIDQASRKLRDALNETEKHELVEMCRRVAEASEVTPGRLAILLKRLQQKLGLPVS
ncbi:hypothetical protein [Notoacmeibacter ruber]|uniref:TerB family tellurite resistance protein n=1 Tax=Notoacmeibacter ruber TaxID=2670375 RepID=A0A3L7JKJ5_9HYPH|nr:hypothetical protein [Notoacmeibacter ruber]RLQ89022.1 hypothetical protein D8780_13045 [Notoacmeibacter ruber]